MDAKTHLHPCGPNGTTTQSCSHFHIWSQVHIISVSLFLDIKNVNLEAEWCQVSCGSLSKYEAKLITQEHNTVTNTPSHLTGDTVQC